MAWTTPRTWAVNEKVTAANMNTYISNNLSHLVSPPFCDLYATAPGNTSGSASTFTAIPFDTEIADTDTMHSTTSNTSRITATTAGLYLVTGSAAIAAQAAASSLYLQVYVSGAAPNSNYSNIYIPASGSGPNITYGLSISRFIRLSAGQYVELMIACTATTVAIASGNNLKPSFQARWMGI